MFAQRFSLASARACRSAVIPASRSTRPAVALVRRAISSTPVHYESLAGINKLQKVPNWQDKEVSLKQLLEDFRNLQSLERVIGSRDQSEASLEYRNAERQIFQMNIGRSDADMCKLRDLEVILPPKWSRAWRTIRERAMDNRVERLTGLDAFTQKVVQFNRIYGIGATFAAKFANAGAKSLDDLLAEMDKPEEKRRWKLSKAQILGVKHAADIEQLIPRKESDQWSDVLLEAANAVDPKFEGEILGSYRRGNAMSSDIDLILRHPDLKRESSDDDFKAKMELISKKMGNKVELMGVMADGPKIFRAMVRFKKEKNAVARRLDISIAPYETYYYKLLGSSGDDRLQKILRARAKDLGLFLNEHGIGKRIPGKGTAHIFDPEDFRHVKSEEEIFEILKLPYLAPTERNFSFYQSTHDYNKFPV